MTTYKGINGFAVQSVATDPSPLDEGQVWYNNATYAFKLAALTTVGTFSSGGTMNNGPRGTGSAQNGTQTAALGAGGAYGTASESYNGTSWTTTSPINSSREAPGGSGTQTAALIFGGNGPAPVYNAVPATESWNGSSWTTLPATLNSDHTGALGGCGTQTATITAGGGTNPALVGNVTAATELWNGSTWTSNPTGLNVKRYTAKMFGIQTAAIISIGNGTDVPPAGPTATESWNGSSWTNVANFPTALSANYGNAGTQTAGVNMGAGNGTIATLWNGTTWTASGSLGSPRATNSGTGTQLAALVFGGATTATEEFTGPGAPVTRTITTS
jgi:hypothetical protein